MYFMLIVILYNNAYITNDLFVSLMAFHFHIFVYFLYFYV